VHVGLVYNDHAVDLHGGILFPSRCGLIFHSESAYLSVCEANNLEILSVYGSDGSCNCLVCKYDRLGAPGVLNASGRRRSSCSDMVVEAQVLLAVLLIRVPNPLRSGFPLCLFQITFRLCADS
jgi:hypothetical protein